VSSTTPTHHASCARLCSTRISVLARCSTLADILTLVWIYRYVLGQAGLVVSLLMLVIAYAVVFLTVLSISAISTNGVVKGGGAYYMISRSLGPEFGGAIGIVFYFANIFASGLYSKGPLCSLPQPRLVLRCEFGVLPRQTQVTLTRARDKCVW
jgi:hypothetical protein